MNRITQRIPTETTGKTRQLLDGVQAKAGSVPNMFRVLANSPAALDAYLSFSGAIAAGTLGGKVRELISLTVSEENHCTYCLSAHSFFAQKRGISEPEIADARQAVAANPKTDAVLKLARAIATDRGQIRDEALDDARTAGLTDGEIMEVTATVALCTFTNYVNLVARTVLDFPEAK